MNFHSSGHSLDVPRRRTNVCCRSQGSLVFDGQGIGQAEILKVADNVWETRDRRFVFTKNQSGLIVGQRTGAGAAGVTATVTVKDWKEGDLGIRLGSTAPEVPVVQLYLGDQHGVVMPSCRWRYAGKISNDKRNRRLAQEKWARIAMQSIATNLQAEPMANRAGEAIAFTGFAHNQRADRAGCRVQRITGTRARQSTRSTSAKPSHIASGVFPPQFVAQYDTPMRAATGWGNA